MIIERMNLLKHKDMLYRFLKKIETELYLYSVEQLDILNNHKKLQFIINNNEIIDIYYTDKKTECY